MSRSDTSRQNTTSTEVSFTLNGLNVQTKTCATSRLSDVLRGELQCLDVKIGCNAGDCGACTVLINGQSRCACLTPITQVHDKHVDTLVGLVTSDPLTDKLCQSFLAHGAAQCGICTPGMLVSATALLRQQSTPTELQVKAALSGVLCRCTGYRKIIDAVINIQKDKPYISGQVGQSVARLDGPPKVNGTDRFGDDVAPADALVLRVLRSPYHHADFSFGDLESYSANTPGISLILTADDIPGANRFGTIPPFIDQPVFARYTTRFKGEAVAAIVGKADSMATLSLDDFPISWQERKALLTVTEAQRPGATQLHENHPQNILCTGLVKRGDAKQGLASAFATAEGNFSTGFVEHAYIEPEAGFAIRVDDRLEIHGCTQAPYLDRGSLAEILELAPEAIRIVPTSTGGGFGSKLDLSYQPFVALAAWKLNQAVRMTYTRTESMQSTTKRHPSNIHMTVGVDEKGKLCGLEFTGTFNTGAYASWGPTVATRVPIHASGPYYLPHYCASSAAVYTHCAPAGAFRGFGVPQATIAQESLFDELASKIGMDRLEFRLLNALDNNIPTVTGQVFETSVGIKHCLQSLQSRWQTALHNAAEFNQSAGPAHSLRRGVGIASAWYGCGNTSLSNPSTIKAGIRRNGSVYLHQGAVDVGQGSNTVITQIFAAALGVPVDKITLVCADTDLTPDAGKTSASRQTFVSGNAARLAGLALRSKILHQSNCPLDARIQLAHNYIIIQSDTEYEHRIDLGKLPESSDAYVLQVEETYDPPTKPLDEDGQGIPYAVFGYAAQLVELTVDIGLGTVKLDRIIAAHDVGKAINPLLVEGQIQGGIAQGIGLALMENFIPGRTDNLHDYLIPTIGDVPPIESIIIEVDEPHGPFGAKGLGEHVLIPTAPAILNAIHHACGARIQHVPASPDKILAAIHALTDADQHG